MDQVITQDPVVKDTIAYDFEHLFAISDKTTAPQLSSNKSSALQKSSSVIWDPFSQHSEQEIQLCTHWANYKEKLDELYWMEVEKSMLRYQPNLNIVDTCKMMSVMIYPLQKNDVRFLIHADLRQLKKSLFK